MVSMHELTEIFESDQILTEPSSVLHYAVDWSKHLELSACGVVFPKNADQVQKLVLWARKNKVALVPSGGRTGLSGAAAATNGELVVSFEKMNQILGFDAFDQTLTVQPGVITEVIQQEAASHGLLFPVDFAARGSSQIGGNIATNAGGLNVLKYGLTRQWVAHLEVITGAGEKLQLNQGLVKNATGYDLRQLFIGSEGTLGFITEVTLKLTRPPAARSVLLLAVEELKQVLPIYQQFSKKIELLAFEMFTREALELVLAHNSDLQNPFDKIFNYYLLIEVEAAGDSSEQSLMEAFETALEQGQVGDGVLAQSPQQNKALWRLREDISEATSHYTPYKNDVSVRISKVTDFLTQTQDLLKKSYPDFKVIWFGHIGDGNLHINILKPKNMAPTEFVDKCQSVNLMLFELIKSFHGSISAEHGVGLLKKPYLAFSKSPQEIQIMKQIKAVFDPDGILNPGKIFD